MNLICTYGPTNCKSTPLQTACDYNLLFLPDALICCSSCRRARLSTVDDVQCTYGPPNCKPTPSQTACDYNLLFLPDVLLCCSSCRCARLSNVDYVLNLFPSVDSTQLPFVQYSRLLDGDVNFPDSLQLLTTCSISFSPSTQPEFPLFSILDADVHVPTSLQGM